LRDAIFVFGPVRFPASIIQEDLQLSGVVGIDYAGGVRNENRMGSQTRPRTNKTHIARRRTKNQSGRDRDRSLRWDELGGCSPHSCLDVGMNVVSYALWEESQWWLCVGFETEDVEGHSSSPIGRFCRLVPRRKAFSDELQRKVFVPAGLKEHFILPSGSSGAWMKVSW